MRFFTGSFVHRGCLERQDDTVDGASVQETLIRMPLTFEGTVSPVRRTPLDPAMQRHGQ